MSRELKCHRCTTRLKHAGNLKCKSAKHNLSACNRHCRYHQPVINIDVVNSFYLKPLFTSKHNNNMTTFWTCLVSLNSVNFWQLQQKDLSNHILQKLYRLLCKLALDSCSTEPGMIRSIPRDIKRCLVRFIRGWSCVTLNGGIRSVQTALIAIRHEMELLHKARVLF